MLDGWNAWANWGGTSRSTPVAAGNLALAYQAFKIKNGRWPTNVEGRALLMSGADNNYNDGFAAGAGVLNAARSAKIAGGDGGVYVLPDSVTFGDYRGTKYPAFTSILHPGDSATQEFTVYNPSSQDVTLSISDDTLVRIGQKEFDLTTINQSQETANFYMPDYLIDIQPYIPAGTQMMEVVIVQPFMEFDPDGNYVANSSWRIVPDRLDRHQRRRQAVDRQERQRRGQLPDCRRRAQLGRRDLRDREGRVHALRLRL